MSELYCSAPWNSLYVHFDGTVKTCCAGMYEIGDLKVHALEDILKGETLKRIQDEVREGKPGEYCALCTKRDAHGDGATERVAYQEKITDFDSFRLEHLDVRWRNLCQLNCVYCSDTASSSWARIKKLRNLEGLDQARSEGVIELAAASPLKGVRLVGGEPLLLSQNVSLLQALPRSTKIDLITNLSVELERSKVARLLLEEFENVNWFISMENVGERFEFVRRPAKWEVFDRNIRELVKMKKTVRALPLYNVFSATDLDDVYDYYQQFEIFIGWQTLHIPIEFNVFSAPDEVRTLARDMALQAFERHKDPQLKKFHDVLGEPRTGLVSREAFWSYLKKTDLLSSVAESRFGELWPALFSAFGGKAS